MKTLKILRLLEEDVHKDNIIHKNQQQFILGGYGDGSGYVQCYIYTVNDQDPFGPYILIASGDCAMNDPDICTATCNQQYAWYPAHCFCF